MTETELQEWAETHYLIVELINSNEHIFDTIRQKYGVGELWSLAFKWTNEFQNKYKDFEWDGEYMDTLEHFFNDKTNGLCSI